MRIVLLLLFAVVAAGAWAEDKVPDSQAEITLTFAPLVKSVAPAVVNIYAQQVVSQRASPFMNDPFFQRFMGGPRVEPRVQNSLGSGVILSADGIVVTNTHVVGQAAEIRVVLADRREYSAEILLSDAEADIAILRMNDATDLPVLELSDSNAAEVGDLVLAIGNPFGIGQTVSSGIVSGLARSGVGGAMTNRQAYFIQTDAPINPGNSGGALVNMAGKLLGVNTSILTRSGGSNGIGFAIPSNLVRTYVDQALQGRSEILRPWSGLVGQPVDSSLAEAFGQPVPRGLLIAGLHIKSPFGLAGLKVGDVVLSLGGGVVNNMPELQFRMMTSRTDRPVPVEFLRNGKVQTRNIAISSAPDDPPSEPIAIAGRSPLTGLTVSVINPVIIDRLSLPLDIEGVVVLMADGVSRRIGLRSGDVLVEVNGTKIDTPEDVIVAAEQTGSEFEMVVVRGGESSRVVFRR